MRIALFALVLALSACQAIPDRGEPPAWASLPAGSRLVLNRDITIPAGRASVYIQEGRLLDFGDVDQYRGYCRFELERVDPLPQRVRADTFLIERIGREMQYTRGDVPGTGQPGFYRVSGSISYTVVATLMRLQSDRQPEVRALTCQRWEIPPDMPRHLTVPEIRRALGSLFTLAPNDAGA